MLKGRTPIVIAGILSLLAFYLVMRTIDTKERNLKEKWSLGKVVVASMDIAEGTVLDIEMAAEHQIPKQFITPSVVKPEQFEKVVGQRLIAQLKRGDPILWSHFRATGTSEHLSNVVRKKGRAITLSVTGAAGVGGWVRPNDHVDILGTFQDPDTNQMVTVTLLKNVIVLATGEITGNTDVKFLERNERSYNNVTVMVIPEEAEIVVLAGQLGQLHLSLRNPEDIGSEEERGRATMKTLLTGQRIKALKKIRERALGTTVVYGPGGGGSHK
jgi:pilus assembly protein CpaB